MALCEQADRAANDLNFVLHQPSDRRTDFLSLRLRYLLHQGKLNEAANTAKAWADEMGDYSEYNCACAWALCAAKAEGAAKQEYLTKSLEHLRRAQKAKFFANAEIVWQLKIDPDLAALRGVKEFDAFVAEVEKGKE